MARTTFLKIASILALYRSDDNKTPTALYAICNSKLFILYRTYSLISINYIILYIIPMISEQSADYNRFICF